jgi:hypothetical protein
MVTALLIWPGISVTQPSSLAGAIYPRSWRCGDADITDHGPFYAYERIVIEIDAVSLARRAEHDYVLCGMPAERMTFGFVVELDEEIEDFYGQLQQAMESALGNVLVTFSIVRADGQIVLTHEREGQLRTDWYWQYGGDPQTFVYAGGLFFVPDPDETYRLRVSVDPQDYDVNMPFRLIASGGGWKAP